MRIMLAAVVALATASPLAADPLTCDLAQYTASNGLTATGEQDTLVVTWTGELGTELRVTYAIDRAQPVIRDLAVRKRDGAWQTLGRNLTPEYHVTRKRLDSRSTNY